jgi:S-formylglutathione hydrolase FrmB
MRSLHRVSVWHQMRTPSRPSILRRLAWWSAPIAVVALGLTWTFDGRGPGVSLLGGAFPRLVEGAAAVAWLAAVARPGRRWWRLTLPALLGITAVLIGGTALALHWTSTVNDHYPPSFAVWVGAVVLAALVCPFRLRERGGGRRHRATGLVAVMAVPLTAASAFLLINNHYGYWPNFGDLVGHRLAGEISSGQLAAALGDASTPGSPAGTAPGEGRLAPLDIPATVSGFSHMAGSVYLPPAFFAGRRHLPVVVMLAGVPNSPAAWPHAGFATVTADAFAASHGGVAPILVFVDGNGSITGDSECVDGPKGRAETYLAVDVPRYVMKTFGASTDPSDWGVVGFSEGGTCALDLALRHPDVYRRFVDLSGDPAPTLGDTARTLSGLYGGDKAAMTAHDPATLLRQQRYPHTDGWFVVGTDDASHRQPGDDLSGPARAAGSRCRT